MDVLEKKGLIWRFKRIKTFINKFKVSIRININRKILNNILALLGKYTN